MGRVVLSHPEKVLFPDAGITKADLAAYYEAVAPAMLPHVRNRPLNLWRWNAGIERQRVVQQEIPKGAPDWVRRVTVSRRKGGDVTHAVGGEAATLVWLANQNCITPHVWTSRAPDLYHPDICVFDLDPSEEDADVLRGAALKLRALLDELGLPSWVKTSGSKGFHIVVPLDGKTEMGQVAAFAHAVGALLVKREPGTLTQEFHKVDRAGRILVDTGRNGYSATFAAPYAVRAKPGAPVSAPCTWEEVEQGGVTPRTFTLRTMAARLDAVGDVWSDLRRSRRSLRRAIDRLRDTLD
jgi:bifunctional non-homologous end joining protein LigD